MFLSLRSINTLKCTKKALMWHSSHKGEYIRVTTLFLNTYIHMHFLIIQYVFIPSTRYRMQPEKFKSKCRSTFLTPRPFSTTILYLISPNWDSLKKHSLFTLLINVNVYSFSLWIYNTRSKNICQAFFRKTFKNFFVI